jgi:predicted MFS family arabinose efflux permease
MYAFVGAGTGFGPIWARRITKDKATKLRIAISGSFLITFIGLAIVAPFPVFGLVLMGTFLRGLGGGINWVFSTQLLLESVPNTVMGRVFSTEFAIMTLASAAAAYAGGWAIDQDVISLNSVLWWMAGMVLFFGFLWASWNSKEKAKNTTSKIT